MTTRLLPQREWDRLSGTPLCAILATHTEDDCKVLVVETDEGQIVGQWALVGLPHLEGIAIDPHHQKGGAVGRRLLQGMRALLKAQGIPTVLTAAADGDTHVAGLLAHLGASPVGAQFYSWTPERNASCQQP